MNAASRDEIRRSGFIAFRHRNYTFYWFARVLGVLAIEMQITAVSWQVWKLTGEPLALGLVGLAQFAPFAFLFIVSGMAADRFPRARILIGCVSIETICALSFFYITITGIVSFPLIFGVLVLLGVARAFQSPAQWALLPVLIPEEQYPNAMAWSSAGHSTARIAGPGVAGLLLIAGTEIVYGVVVVLLVLSTIFTLLLRVKTQIISKDPITIENLSIGLRFIFSRQVVLGSVLLDLFAVLLGGARALLPIFADQILLVGAVGFGSLRAADMVGALVCMLFLTQMPIRRHAGIKLLATVGLFGITIMIFGLSTSFWVSLAALFFMGASDAISVFIRNNVVMVVAPDEIRGRVTAINSVFIGASNEVGEFESGVTADWWGTVPAQPTPFPKAIGGSHSIAHGIVEAR